MAETVGSLVDKLSIVELRRWHAEEAMLNPRAPEEIRHECALQLKIIDEQRSDLIDEISSLWQQVLAGGRPPKVYRRLEMHEAPRQSEASSSTKSPNAKSPAVIDFEHHRARKRATERP